MNPEEMGYLNGKREAPPTQDNRTPGELERLALRVIQSDGLIRQEREYIASLLRAQTAEPVAELIEARNADFGDMRIRFIKIRIGVDAPMPEGTEFYLAAPPAPEGMVLVPMELEGEMLFEMWRAINGGMTRDHDSLRYAWKRTIRAALKGQS